MEIQGKAIRKGFFPMATKYQEFPSFLYRKFSFLKEHRVEDVVEGLNELGYEVSASTFRKYVRGEFSLPPDLIGPLYTVTQDNGVS